MEEQLSAVQQGVVDRVAALAAEVEGNANAAEEARGAVRAEAGAAARRLDAELEEGRAAAGRAAAQLRQQLADDAEVAAARAQRCVGAESNNRLVVDSHGGVSCHQLLMLPLAHYACSGLGAATSRLEVELNALKEAAADAGRVQVDTA